eukprot:c7204_g1_i1.p1 GENE.c7204_g1_i1~~c7204_g1_i1.p1  ORF type:complete len:114 (-),score=30.73 c7204_g1_i1:198-539(-)
MGDKLDKAFRVKLGVVGRIVKDVRMYQKEVVDERARLESFIQKGQETRQQEQVVKESEQMIPDALRRLNEAIEDLEADIEGEADNQNFSQSETYAQAKKAVAEAKAFLDSLGN